MNPHWCAVLVLFATPVFAQDAGVAAPAAAASADEPEGETAEAAKVDPLDVKMMPFTPDSIRRVISHHQPQIQACYEETLASRSKAVEGTLSTSFVINKAGLVKKAKVLRKGTTLKMKPLHECVVATLSALTFPAPPDGKDHPVQYPFNLKAIH